MTAMDFSEIGSSLSQFSAEAIAAGASMASLSAEQTAAALAAAGYSSIETAAAMATAGYDAATVAAALSTQGLTTEQIAGAMSATQFTASQIAAALAAQGVGESAIIAALEATGLSSAEAAAAVTAGTMAAANGTAAVATAGLAASLKAAAAGLATFLLTNPVGWAILAAGAIFGVVKVVDALTESFDEACDKASEARSTYETALNDVKDVESKQDSLRSKVEELATEHGVTFTDEDTIQDIINKLKELNLSATDAQSLSALETTNAQLSSQLAIKQKIAEYDQQEAAEDANHVLTKDLTWQTGDFLKDKNGYMMTDTNGMPIMEYMSGDIIDRATSKQEKLNEKKAEQVKLEEEIANMEPEYHKHFWQADTEYEQKTKQLKNLKSDVSDLEKEVSEDVETINSNYSSLFSTDGSVLPGYEDTVNRINDLFDAYNNVDLSEAEKKLNKINSFFDGSTGKNFIKDNLLEAAKQAELTADDIKRMGIAIDGVDASDIAKYFNDLAASADEAAESITGVDGSIAGVKAAMDSKNKDQDWTDMADALSKAQELYKKGKVGTDDFQTAAQFMTYGKINPDDYKYDADAYVEYWEKAQQKIKRYFDSDNPLQSVTNFADDLVKSGFATKDNGEFSWTKKFKNSAAAAKELGISVEATESLMHSLESYGAEFDDVVFSAEGLNRYKTALDGIHSVYKDMEDGQLKKHLGSLIENWDDEYQKYQDDMTELTEDQIVHIEFVYDLSTIQAQIDELTAKQSGQGGKNADTNAEVLAGNQKYLTTAKQGLQVDNVSAEVQAKIKVNENTINDLYDQLSKEEYGSNKFIEIQAKIQNTQELQKSILNAFSETHPEINTDSSIEEVQSAWEDFFSKPQELHVNAELSTDEIQSQLEQLASGSSITFNADVDGDGIEDEVKALKNQDGTITYTAEIDGVQKKIEVLQGEDNTLTFNILAEDQATPVIEDVNKRELISKTCALYSEDYATQLIQLWNDASANPKFASLSAEDQATWVINTWNSLTPEQKEAYLNGEISITDTATGEIQTVDNALNSLQPKLSPKANITATENATSVASSAASALNGVNGKTSNMYIYTHHIDTYSSTGKGKLLGTARYGGTARASGTLFDTSWLKDSWKTKVSEDALTGEKGQEIVVNGNQWWTVGDRGAEFAHIPEGSIVFDAEQSRQLLSSGKINSRGRSYLGGTAYASGWRLPSTSGGSSSKSSSKSSGKSSSKSSGKSSGSSGRSSSSSKSSSSSSSSSTEKDFEETFDWIEIAINRISEAIDRVKVKAESAFKTLAKRNSAAADEISLITQQINTQNQAYTRYMQQANSVGLSSDWMDKVKNGTIDISTITDEDLSDKIKDFQDFYEKAIEAKDAVADLHEEIAKLYADRFSNISTDFDNQLALVQHLTDTYNTGLDTLEAKGLKGSKVYYQALQKAEKENQAILQKELVDLTESFNQAMASGEIEKGSEQWYEMQKSINDVKEAIDESNLSLLEYQKTMRELDWEYFDYMEDRISNITDEADFLIDLMANGKLFDDKGQMTDTGMATMGLHGQNYNVDMAQADQYAKAIKELNAEIAKDPYNTDLIERRQELLELQRKSILAAEDEKQAMIDLVKDGIEAQLDSLKDLIDAYTDSLDSAKDLYDYQKKVKEQSDEIASLQKQLSAYAGDNSEETKATIQKIQVDLSKAMEELQETEYDRYITDQKKLLDDLYNEYELSLNARLDNVDAFLSDMIDSINANSSSISDTIQQECANVGYTLSETMNSIWTNDGGAFTVISKYGDQFLTQNTSTLNAILGIKAYTDALIAKADAEAKAKAEATKKQTEASKPASQPSKPSNNTHSTPSKPARTDKDYYGVALAIWNGNYGWGTGNTRVSRLQAKGFDANRVQSIVNQMGREGYVRSGAWVGRYQGIRDLSPYHYNKYAVGLKNAPKAENAWVNELGSESIVKPSENAIVTHIAKGDSVLTADATRNIWDMASDPSGFISGNLFNNGILSGLEPYMRVNNNSIGEVTFNLPNVTNYEEFMNRAKKDEKFEDMIQAMTIGVVAGKSTLAKNKYKW